MTKKIYVVVEHYNDYDQHGGYYMATFSKYPSLETLERQTGYNHIGRNNNEYSWVEIDEDIIHD